MGTWLTLELMERDTFVRLTLVIFLAGACAFTLGRQMLWQSAEIKASPFAPFQAVAR